MALGITDTTAYAPPYPVGTVLTISLQETGGAGGPYTWAVGLVDPATGLINSGSSGGGTGTTFAFDAALVGVGNASYLVQVYDATSATYAYYTAGPIVVEPIRIPVRTAAGNLTDGDAFKLTKADPTAGAFTLTFTVSAANRGFVWWGLKNIATVNNVTVAVPSGEYADGVLNGTIVLGPGDSLYIHADNYSKFDAVV